MLRIVAIASALLFVLPPAPADAGAPLLLGLRAGAAAGAVGTLRGLGGAVGRGSSTRGLGGSVARGVGRYGLDGLDDDGWSEGLRQGHQEMSDALRRGRDSIRFDQGPPLNFNNNPIRFDQGPQLNFNENPIRFDQGPQLNFNSNIRF
jgi:hypothetical protein